MKLKNKNKGITLIALIITIIILLILAGITIVQLTGNGLFDKVKLAKEKSEEKQKEENATLGDYENKIGEYIDGTRNNATTNVLWEGNTSKGTLNLTDSIYNYDFIIVCAEYNMSDVVFINKNGENEIRGGKNYAFKGSNAVEYWGFYISLVPDDGKQLVLERSGYGNYNTNWNNIVNINRIVGLKI